MSTSLTHSAQFQPSTVEEREHYEKVLPHPEPQTAEFSAKKNSVLLPFVGVAMGLPIIIGLLAVPTFVIVPFMVKQVKPEWSYGKRVVVGIGTTTVLGLTRQLISKL